MTEVRLKILPPWSIVIKELVALFDGDPQIAFNVNFDGSDPSIEISCNNGDKLTALSKIIPEVYDFGNVILNVSFNGTPSNRAFKNKKELFETAFEGNPAFAYAVMPSSEDWYPSAVYVVFKNHVVQFFADNLSDCHGIISCLYQDLADEVLDCDACEGVYFNTDVEHAVGKTIEGWLE